MGLDRYDQQRFLMLAHIDADTNLSNGFDPFSSSVLGPATNTVIVGTGPQARVGILESPNLGKGKKTALVRFFDEDQGGWHVDEVAKGEIQLSMQAGDDMDVAHVRAMAGQETPRVLPTSKYGTGVLDESLGIAGINDRKAYKSALLNLVEKEITKKKWLDRDGNFLLNRKRGEAPPAPAPVKTKPQPRKVWFDDRGQPISRSLELEPAPETPSASTSIYPDRQDLGNLVDMYIRAADTGNLGAFEQKLVSTAGANTEALGQLRAEAYPKLLRMHAPDGDNNLVRALVLSKLNMLDELQARQLRKAAEGLGIKTKGRKMTNVVEDLLPHYDQSLGIQMEETTWKEFLHQIVNNQRGSASLGALTGFAPDVLKGVKGKLAEKFFPGTPVIHIRDVQPPKDLSLTAMHIGLPKTVGSKIPTIDFLRIGATRAHGRANQKARDLRILLEDHWMHMDPDEVHIQRAMSLYQRGHRTWDDVLKRTPPGEFQRLEKTMKFTNRDGKLDEFPFSEFFESFARTADETRLSLLRSHLMAGHRAFEFDPDDGAHVMMARQDLFLHDAVKEYDTLRDAAGTILMAGRDPATGLHSTKNPDDVEYFLREIIGPGYRSWSDVPKPVRELVESDPSKVWMTNRTRSGGEFQFWSLLGRNDPLPLVHEGRVKVIAHGRDQQGAPTTKTLGYAPNTVEALRLLRHPSMKERFDGVPDFRGIEIDASNVVLSGSDLSLDSDWRVLQKITEEINLSKTGGFTNEELAVLTGSLVAPQGAPVTIRTKGESLEPSTYKRLAVLFRRATQADYKADVLRTSHQAVSLDAEFSKVFGVPRLFADMPDDMNLSDALIHARRHQGDNVRAKHYFDTYLRIALGERGNTEMRADHLLSRWAHLHSLPKKALEKVLTGNDVKFGYNAGEFYMPYRTRKLSKDILDFQAVWRLGYSPAAAAVNGMQWAVNTGPMLGYRNTMAAFDDWHSLWAQRAKFADLDTKYGRDWYTNWRKGDLEISETFNDVELNKALDLYDLLYEAGVEYAVPRSQSMEAWGMKAGEKGGSKLLADPNEQLFNFTKAWTWAEWNSMVMFQKAEKLNRSLTAFAAARYAATPEGGELQGKALTAFIEDMIDATQFTYHDLGLSPAMANPIGKVIFQFKPFLANQIRYEANMLSKLVRSRGPDRTQAVVQIAEHLGTIGLLGGTSAFMYNPIIYGGLAAASTFDNDTSPESLLNDVLYHRMGKFSADRYHQQGIKRFNTPWWDAHTVVSHGLFGLLGMDVSRRLSLSGPELFLSTGNDAVAAGVGPHMSMYWHYMKAMRDQETPASGFSKNAMGLALAAFMFPTLKGAGGLVAGLTASGLTSMIDGGRPIWDPKTLGSTVSKYGGGIPFLPIKAPREKENFDFYTGALSESKSGRRFMMNVMPVAFRNISNTATILSTGMIWDLGGNPDFMDTLMHTSKQRILPGMPASSQTQLWEALIRLGGFRSTRSTVDRMATTLVRDENEKYIRLADSYADRMAAAYIARNPIEMSKLQAELLQKYGIVVSRSQIETRVNALLTPMAEKVMGDAPVRLKSSRRLR